MPFTDVIGHERAKAMLQTAISRGRVAHAYLFHGPDRIGKRLLAIRFAQALLCDGAHPESETDSCGICRNCRQVEAHTHPDLTYIQPDQEQANPQIKIEQIRTIEQHLIYRPLIGERKLCLVDDADRMTIGAANALLKTLEEPPDHSVFVLISSRVAALPATIRSRCQALRLTPPARTQVEAAVIVRRNLSPSDARFLAILSDGQLGRALELDIDAEKSRLRDYASLLKPSGLASGGALLATAETLAKTERVEEALTWLQQQLRDLVVLAVAGPSDEVLDTDVERALGLAASTVDLERLLDLLQDIDHVQRQGHRHLNLQMALENVLLQLRSLCTPAPVSPH